MEEKVKLTAKDWMILSELDFNARISENKLAKKIGLSKVTVRYRQARLERLGVIKRYFIVANAPKRGLISTRVMLKYRKTSKETEEEILSTLQEKKEVGWIIETEGTFNLVFIVWTENVFGFEKFYNRFLDSFSEFFSERKTVIIAEHHVCNKKYLPATDEVKLVSYSGAPESIIDETDKKILELLQENSKAKTIEISKKIGLTPEAIAYRIKKLVENNVILAFRAMIDLDKIGFQYYNILIKLSKTNIIPKLFGFCREHKNVTYFTKYIGEYDIGLDIEVKDAAGFRKIMDELRERFGESMLTYEYANVFNERKISY